MEIKVFMFGDFKVLVDGVNIVEKLSNSRKNLDLLEYFLLNKDRHIITSDLFDDLWIGDDCDNPEGTLRTRISRFRADLTRAGLKGAVVTGAGFYRWNPAYDTSVDVFEFEEVCKKVEHCTSLRGCEEDFIKAFELYGGDLLSNTLSNSWVVPKSVYYHDLYIETMKKYTKFLEEERRFNEINRICRKALEIDPFESELNLMLMNALIKTGKSQEAYTRYEYATGLHYSYLGVSPSEEMLDFYKNLIRVDRNSEQDIDNISRELAQTDESEGAFICEYAIFRDIYKVYMRNLRRLDITIFLAVITMGDVNRTQGEDFTILDKSMNEFCDMMKDNLRKGDVITRYSPSQFALLLPTVNLTTGQVVLNRLKDKFNEKFPSGRFVIDYKLKPLIEYQV
ncbi:MAG: hypothetical protein GX061_08520 [Eubacteriaceae bacterium]|nr:hypothetical protein [Eubacteriaceae bacterium]